MAETKKSRLFDLPETKGSFQLKGVVNGTDKDNFFKDLKTKTGRAMRVVNFGVEYMANETLYVTLQGLEQDYVFFYKRAENKGEKGDVARVPWAERATYKREGYRLIGKNLGVKKTIDAEGKTVNDKKTLVDFDACAEIKNNLKDNNCVFIRGDLSYNSFTDDKGNKRVSTRLEPAQVSLCADIDFTDADYSKTNDFNQVIVFTGIDQEKNDSGVSTGRFIVSAKIVTYSTIEDVEYIILDNKLASMFKKRLKPYNAIKVSGHMQVFAQTEEVEDDDDWGETDAMERISAPVKREFVITGAKGTTLDKDTYSQDKVETALSAIARSKKADSDFGKSDTNSNDDWGESSDDDDDETAW